MNLTEQETDWLEKHLYEELETNKYDEMSKLIMQNIIRKLIKD